MARLLFIVGAVLVISFCNSDAIIWTKRPNNPTIVVEGVNNTNVRLVWLFLLEPRDTLMQVSFQRQKPGAVITTRLASRLASSAFTIFPPYQQEYAATLPNTLLLRNVTKNEYIYSIVVVYQRNGIIQPDFTDQVKVVVYARPRINKYQGDPVRHTLVEGNNLTLHCNVTAGSPKPTISWYFGWTTTVKKVEPIHYSRYSFPTDQEFTITGVERRDEGKYRCIAENLAGKDELRFEISAVVDAFQWTKQPNKPTIVVEGVNNTDVRLVWEFLLGPGEILVGVSFQRQKPGAVITTTIASRLANSAFTIAPLHRQEYAATLPNTLLLRNVTKNEYIYSIVVLYATTHRITKIRDQVKVVVYARPRINKYQGDPVRHTLVEGNNITFHCNVTAGSPKPTISWYFGWTTTDKKVDPIHDSRYSFPTDQEFTITGVERRDEGKYRCIAENIAGKDELRFEISAAVVCQDTWPKSTCRYFKKYCDHPAIYSICKKTCNMCGSCADKWPEVFCRLYRQWCHYPSVLINCRKSCKTCSDTKLD